MTRRSGGGWIVGFALAMGCASEDDDAATTVATTPGGTDDGATAPDDDGDEGADDAPDDGVDDGPATADDGPSTSPPETGADDDPPVTTGPADTGDEGPGDGEDTGNAEAPEGSGGGDALQMCLDMADDECEDCACMNCLAEVQACEMDPGCVEIRMCAQENMCTGIECRGPCGPVIEENGGPFG